MSLKAMQFVFELPVKDPHLKAVLLALADHACNEKGLCYPSISTVSLYSGCSERTVQRKIAEAIELGLITVIVRPSRTNLYQFTFDASGVEPRHGDTPVTVTPRQADTPRHGDTPTPSGRHPDPVTVTPEPSNEPSDEPSGMGVPAKATLEAALDAWNAMARVNGLPEARTLTEPRKRALRHRLKEAGGLEGWRQAMARVGRSSFLTGRRGDSRWRADFDFVLQAKSFTKLLEGAYDDRGQPPPRPKGTAPAPTGPRRDIPPGWSALKFAEATQAEIDAAWAEFERTRNAA